MAKEFNIPGLKDAVSEVERLQEAVRKTAADILTLATNSEKALQPFKNNSGLKDFTELNAKATESQKKLTAEIDKLEAAEKKLAFAQSDLGKKIAAVNLETQKQNVANKNAAQQTNETSSALDRYNAKLNQATKESKELGAAMALLAMEGKKDSVEFNKLEKEFEEAAKKSKLLNDTYREFSKQSGDNRALVGSYSTELQGHFNDLNSTFSSLKNNIQSGNIPGIFNDAKTVVVGFGKTLSDTTKGASGANAEFSKTGNVFSNIKTTATDAGKATVQFFKPSEENSAKMTEGLERIKIGFTKNDDAVKALKATQTEHNLVAEKSNENTKTGGIMSNLYARAQMALSGATSVASAGFNILKVAIASTGIGAILIAVALLISYFATFQPLIDFVQQKFGGLTAAFNILQQVLVDFISNLKSIGDFFSKIGDFLEHPIESFKSLGKEMNDARIAGEKLVKQQQDLADAMDVQAVRNKDAENQIAKLMLQAKNRTLTEAERIALLKKADEIEAQNYKERNKLATDEKDQAIAALQLKKALTAEEVEILRKGHAEAVAILKQKQDDGIFKITDDEIKAYTDAIMKKAELVGESVKVQETIQNRSDALYEKAEKKREEQEKEALENRKKTSEEAIKVMKITLDNLISNYDQASKLDAENIAHVEAISEMKIAIAKAERDKNLIGVAKGSIDEQSIIAAGNQEIIKINQERAKAINKITFDRAAFELELYDLNNKTILDGSKDLTDLLVEEEKRRLKETLAVHKDRMRAELQIDKDTTDEKLKLFAKSGAQLTANEIKYLKFIEKEEAATNNQIKKNDADLLKVKLANIDAEQKVELRKYRLLQKGELDNQKFEFKILDEKLKKDRKVFEEDQKREGITVKEHDENAKKIADIDLQLAENKVKLDKIIDASKKESLDTGLNALIEITGKESAVGKAAAIAQATINTYVGATKEFEKGGILGFATGALVVAAGLATVAKIVGINAFAKGTTDAPYTGRGIVDEEGAEIHTDKHGNIKSMGSSSGAHFTDIVKGDKIIPADISSIIKKTMFSQYKIGSKLADGIDYDKMGDQFGKYAGHIVRAVKEKKTASTNIFIAANSRDRVTFKGQKV